MPQNDDYLGRRHERREAARKRREAEARRIRRTLFAAFLALILCGVAFYNLTKGIRPEKTEDVQAVATEATEAVPEKTRPTRPVEKDPITKIHIKAAGDLYGREITLEFHYFLRPEKKFPSVEALKEEIYRDGEATRLYLHRLFAV